MIILTFCVCVFYRVLQLDCAPEGLVFCSQQADIMIALHTHLHTISSTTCERKPSASLKDLVAT